MCNVVMPLKDRRIGKLKDGKGNVYPILRMPKEWADLIGKNVSMERTVLGGREAIILYVAEPSAQSVQSSVQSTGKPSLGRRWPGEPVGTCPPGFKSLPRRQNSSIELDGRRTLFLDVMRPTLYAVSPVQPLPRLGFPVLCTELCTD